MPAKGSTSVTTSDGCRLLNGRFPPVVPVVCACTLTNAMHNPITNKRAMPIILDTSTKKERCLYDVNDSVRTASIPRCSSEKGGNALPHRHTAPCTEKRLHS